LVILLAASSAYAHDACPPVYEDGARCLFAGHSFFIPIANQFDGLATTNGYLDHEFNWVFSSGANGSPLALWNDTDDKAEIEGVLADGDVELFGLTTAFGVGSEVEDYARWIDLALSYNPDTDFLIGVPWVVGGPNFPSAAEFADLNETTGQTEYEKVELLRDAYPEVTIHYIHYAHTASIMWLMFEEGQLPDILGLTPNPPKVPASNALFADGAMGHGGPMMTELAALTWMEILYGARVESLFFTEYQSDVNAIVNEVTAHNRPYQDVPDDAWLAFSDCLLGPGVSLGIGCACLDYDGDADGDLRDFAEFQWRVDATVN
jgi:hypothetical protein